MWWRSGKRAALASALAFSIGTTWSPSAENSHVRCGSRRWATRVGSICHSNCLSWASLIPACRQLAAGLGHFPLAGLEHVVQVAAGEHDEHGMKRVIQAGGRGDDKPAQAGSLDGDVTGVHVRQDGDRIAAAADVADRLADQRKQLVRRRIAAVRIAFTIVRQMNQEAVHSGRLKAAGKQPPDRHRTPGFMHDQHGGSGADRALLVARHVPLQRHAVVHGVTAGNGRRELHQGVVRRSRFGAARDGECGRESKPRPRRQEAASATGSVASCQRVASLVGTRFDSASRPAASEEAASSDGDEPQRGNRDAVRPRDRL